MLKLRIAFFVVTLIVSSYHSFSQNTNSITYIANEGVLIEIGENRVLIDALFNFPKNSAPSDVELNSIINGNDPYQNIDVALVSHSHSDHFNAALYTDYLTKNKKLILVGPSQAYDSLSSFYSKFSEISDQIVPIAKNTTWHSFKKGEITINSAFVRHINLKNYNIQNLCHIVEVGDKTVAHFGDADMDSDLFEHINIKERPIDVALIPFWFLVSDQGAEIIKNHVKANKIIAIHFPRTGGEMTVKGIKQLFPESIIFETPGARVEF